MGVLTHSYMACIYGGHYNDAGIRGLVHNTSIYGVIYGAHYNDVSIHGLVHNISIYGMNLWWTLQ